MLDLLIKDGLIIDGAGNPGFYGAIGVDGDSITILRGDVSTVEARGVVDATGKVVCPGFIDVHAHSALMILADPLHTPKVHQGITTELIGIDGNSYAPFKSQEDLQGFIDINSGLDGRPPLPGTWSSVQEYLAMYDNKVAVNIAYILGNSPIRIGAVGWDDRPATSQEIEDMKAILRESMEEGAIGISTGLDYPPGSYADTDELVALSAEAARLGGIYHTHVRYGLGDRYFDPFEEAIEIGRRSGICASRSGDASSCSRRFRSRSKSSCRCRWTASSSRTSRCRPAPSRPTCSPSWRRASRSTCTCWRCGAWRRSPGSSR